MMALSSGNQKIIYKKKKKIARQTAKDMAAVMHEMVSPKMASGLCDLTITFSIT